MMNDDRHCSFDDILYQVEVNLVLSGLASVNPEWIESPETACRHWIIPEGSDVRSLISSSVVEVDGIDEYKAICAEAAHTKNPFLAFRQRMSLEALEKFNAKLVNTIANRHSPTESP